MSAAPRERPRGRTTKRPGIYYGCGWAKENLENVGRLFEEELGEVVFHTWRNGVRLEGRSLDELIEEIKLCNEPGRKNEVDNLTVSAVDGDRSVELSIDRQRSEFLVEGANSNWSSGLASRLGSHLEHAGGRTRPPRTLRYLLPLIVGPVLAGILGVAAIRGMGTVFLWWAALFVLSGTGVAYFAGRNRDVRSRTRVNPYGELPPNNWWARMTRTEKIMSIGVLMTCLGWLTALLSWLTNVWRS